MKLRTIALILAAALCLSLAACGSSAQNNTQNNATQLANTANQTENTVPANNTTNQTENKNRVAKDGAVMQTEDKSMPTRVPAENGTKINMYFGDTLITGVLNDSETAKALISKLPITQHVSRYSHDFCGVTEELPYNEADVHYGWLNGDIDYALNAPYFTILFEDEDVSEQYGYQVNIGVITCPLSDIAALKGDYDVRIELAEETPAGSGSDAAVVYFSRVGNTDFPANVDAVSSASLLSDGGTIKGNAQMMAEWIASEAGCEAFEIVANDPYPADYNATVDQAKTEQRSSVRPTLKSDLSNLEQYKTIYLVFPNWWADLPMPLYTFFESYDLSGKTINVFITHEGSGFSGTINTISKLEPGAAVVKGLSVRGGSVASEEQNIRNWVRNNK